MKTKISKERLGHARDLEKRVQGFVMLVGYVPGGLTYEDINRIELHFDKGLYSKDHAWNYVEWLRLTEPSAAGHPNPWRDKHSDSHWVYECKIDADDVDIHQERADREGISRAQAKHRNFVDSLDEHARISRARAVEQLKMNIEQDMSALLGKPYKANTLAKVEEIANRRFQEAVNRGDFPPATTYEIKDIRIDGESIMNAKDINSIIDFKSTKTALEPIKVGDEVEHLTCRNAGVRRVVTKVDGAKIYYDVVFDSGRTCAGIYDDVKLLRVVKRAEPEPAPEPIKVGDEVEHLICPNGGIRRVVTGINGKDVYYDVIFNNGTTCGYGAFDDVQNLRVVKRAEPAPAPEPELLPAASYGFYANEPDIDRIFRENPGCNVIEVNDQVWVRNNVFNFVRDHFNLVKVGIDETTPDGHELILVAVEDIVLALRNRKHFTVKAYR